MKGWLLPALATLLSWGLWAYLPKLAVKYIDTESSIIYQIMGGVLVGIGAFIMTNFHVQFHKAGFLYSLGAGALGFLGAYFYLISVTRGPVSIVAPLTALYPVIVIILGYVFLSEPISPRQGIGITLSVIAIFLISS